MQYLLSQDEYDEYLSLRERSEELESSHVDKFEEIKNLVLHSDSIMTRENLEHMSNEVCIIIQEHKIPHNILDIIKLKMKML